MGIANFHDVFEKFPRPTVEHPDLPPQRRLSWLTDTLVYTTQICMPTDRSKPWDDEKNLLLECRNLDEGTVYNIRNIRCFVCPVPPRRQTPNRPGPTDYVGIAGLGRDAADLPLGYPYAGLVEQRVGLFGHDRTVAYSNIKDGTANTLSVVETSWENGPWTAGGHPTVRGLDERRPYPGTGAQFGGMHRNGAMCLFVDGSARLLGNTMSPNVFEALATIAGGEELGQLD